MSVNHSSYCCADHPAMPVRRWNTSLLRIAHSPSSSRSTRGWPVTSSTPSCTLIRRRLSASASLSATSGSLTAASRSARCSPATRRLIPVRRRAAAATRSRSFPADSRANRRCAAAPAGVADHADIDAAMSSSIFERNSRTPSRRRPRLPGNIPHARRGPAPRGEQRVAAASTTARSPPPAAAAAVTGRCAEVGRRRAVVKDPRRPPRRPAVHRARARPPVDPAEAVDQDEPRHRWHLVDDDVVALGVDALEHPVRLHRQLGQRLRLDVVPLLDRLPLAYGDAGRTTGMASATSRSRCGTSTVTSRSNASTRAARVGSVGVAVYSRAAPVTAPAAGSMRACRPRASRGTGRRRVALPDQRPEADVLAAVVRVQERHHPRHVLAQGPPLPALRSRRGGQHLAAPEQVSIRARRGRFPSSGCRPEHRGSSCDSPPCPSLELI